MEEQYNVLISGKRSSEDALQVSQKLGALFKCPAEHAMGLLSLQSYAVKTNVTGEMAAKYKRAIEDTGAVCILERIEPETPALDFDIAPPITPAAVPASPQRSMPLPASPEPLSRAEAVKLFVGKNHEYFARKWEIASKHKNRQSWNWAAFLVGFGWMGYRKMYLYSGIFIAVIGAETLCEIAFGFPGWLSGAVNVFMACFFGAQGNTLYQRHVDKQVDAILASHPPEQARMELTRRGGTNFGAAIGLVVALLVLLTLIVAVVGVQE